MSIAKIVGAVAAVIALVGTGIYLRISGEKGDPAEGETTPPSELDKLNKAVTDNEAASETLKHAHFKAAIGKFVEEAEQAYKELTMLQEKQ